MMFHSVQRLLIVAAVASAVFTTSRAYRLNSKLIDSPPFPNVSSSGGSDEMRQLDDSATNTAVASTADGYVKASIPVQIFRCIQHANIMRCLKLFMLQRIERTSANGEYPNSGNVTADFLDQILQRNGEPNNSDDDNDLAAAYGDVSDGQLNERLVRSVRRFFQDREIKLYFVPGMVVKVVPSTEQLLSFTVRKAKRARNKDLDVPEEDDAVKEGGGGGGGGLIGGGKNKRKTAEYLLQLGVPALMMPAILLGTVLPFMLPALKMATILSTLINHGALLTAAMYAAKQAAFSDRVYYQPGYHRGYDES